MVQKIHSKDSGVLPKSAPLCCSFIKLKGGVVFRPYLKRSLTKCTTRVQTRKGPLLAQTNQLWQRQRSWPNIDIQIHSSRQRQSDEKSIPRRLNQSHGLKACMGTQAVGLHFQNGSFCTVDSFLFYSHVLLLYIMEFSCIK